MIAIQFAAVFFFANALPGLAFVFHFTRNRENVGIFDKFILSVILSPLVLILISFLEEAGGIPQSGRYLGINIAVIAVANIILLVRFFPERHNFALRLNWVKLFVYGLFGMLLVFRVWPTHDLLAPILHDPIAHTEWLKQLNTTHFTTTEQWYPQGLVLYLNYFVTFLPVSYPQAVLTSANVMVALFPISLFYLGFLTYGKKDRWMIFPLIMFVFAARLAYPNEFYYIAGKNSMILAFAIAPPLIYLITSLKNRWEIAAAAVLTFAVVVIHYPTGFFLLFMLFFLNLRQVAAIESRRIVLDRGHLWGYLAALGAVAGLGAVLLMKMLPIYQGHPVGEDGSFSLTIISVEQNGVIPFISRNFLTDLLNSYRAPAILVFAASLSAFLVVRDRFSELPGKLLVNYLALYLIGVLFLLAGMVGLGVNYNIEVRFFLVFVMIVMMAWFGHHLVDRSISRVGYRSLASGAVVVLLGLVFLQGGLNQYRQYVLHGGARETVAQEDLNAFEFIKQSVPAQSRFLIQLGSPLPNNGIIAGADSGVWIPTFADRPVEVDFLQFTGTRSSQIFDLYLALAKNGDDGDAISRLYCDYGIDHVYFGSRQVFFENMKRATLDRSSRFEKIYDDTATIYRIKPVSCPA